MAHAELSRDPEVHKRNPNICRIFKFENKSRTTCSRFLQSFALLGKTVQLQTHDTTTQEERKMSGQSRRGSGFLLSFVRACFDFLTTLTFRALHGSRILSTPFETIMKKKKNKTQRRRKLVAHMPTDVRTFHDGLYLSHHCFSPFCVSPGHPGQFSN